MKQKPDVVTDLNEEVMTDVASHFFGKRSELQNAIDLVYEYIAALQEKGEDLKQSIQFLNYLLIRPENMAAFWRDIGAPGDAFMETGRLIQNLVPPSKNRSFTLKGRYIHLMSQVYAIVYKRRQDYMCGSPGMDCNQTQSAHHGLVQGMCHLINEQIREINRNMTPGQILSYIRQYDIINQERENIMGADIHFRDDCEMNKSMAFQEIDFNCLGLTAYPLIPNLEKAESTIRFLCRKICSEDRPSVARVMDSVKG